MYKKILSAVLAATMVVSVTACGANAGSTPTTAAEVAEATTAAGVIDDSGAATYTPSGNFNIRVFAAAGGIADTVTRIAAQGLQEDYGVTAVVNNLTGASGAVAAADMDSYDPSIHELSVVSMSLFTMAPLMNPDVKVSLDNYEIVGSLIHDEFVLMTSAKSGIKSWEELVEYSKGNKVIYGSNTPGGGTHVVQVALFGEAGIDAQALTSDGSNKDILAVMSGDAICAATTVSLAKTYIESGEMVPIAVFAEESYTGFEGVEVPTVKSLGYDIVLPSYNFMICRAGVPAEETSGLYNAMLKYRESDSFKDQAANANYVPDDTDGVTLKTKIAEYAKTCKVIYDKYYAK